MNGTMPPAADPDFDALVAQGLRLLPVHAPQWTNHNASDPGITLLELLAYFSDALLYRLGRVGTASRVEFLRLLRGQAGPDEFSAGTPDAAAVRAALAQALEQLAWQDSAVTVQDHERLARHALDALPAGAQARTRCLPDTDLERLARTRGAFAAGEDEGHLSLVVAAPAGSTPAQKAALLAGVRAALEPHRLLTCRLHVVAPVAVHVALRAWVTPAAGSARPALAARIAATLDGWEPETSETADGTLSLAGIADRIAALDGVQGVDHLMLAAASLELDDLAQDTAALGLQLGLRARLGRDARLGLRPPLQTDRLLRDGDGQLAALVLRPWEVARLVVRPADVAWSGAGRWNAG
ncbi:hypothetical protein [Pseudorhodoferax sp.]|uniref:hypothetical protein n=1 Tax=Pseudorhodoferax sp. TaxID=1993553 RepID=UPI002DD67A5A|nr:hypothetical protein [Pseudorhodoferax sp.]